MAFKSPPQDFNFKMQQAVNLSTKSPTVLTEWSPAPELDQTKDQLNKTGD